MVIVFPHRNTNFMVIKKAAVVSCGKSWSIKISLPTSPNYKCFLVSTYPQSMFGEYDLVESLRYFHIGKALLQKMYIGGLIHVHYICSLNSYVKKRQKKCTQKKKLEGALINSLVQPSSWLLVIIRQVKGCCCSLWILRQEHIQTKHKRECKAALV